MAIHAGSKMYVEDAVSLGLLKEDPTRITHEQRLLLAKYEWLSPAECILLLAAHQAGEHGLLGQKARKMGEMVEEGWLRLDACGMIQWQRDQRGRLAYLVLTAKGEQLADALILVNHPNNRSTVAQEPQSGV